MMGLAGSGVVVELDLPAPLAVVVGMPPGLEDAGLPAGQDDQAPQVVGGGPAVLQQDGVVLADQVAHRAGLAAFQPLAVGEQRAVLVADGDLEGGWGGMDQQPVPGRLVVDPAAGKGDPGRARVGKPQIPDLQHGLLLSVCRQPGGQSPSQRAPSSRAGPKLLLAELQEEFLHLVLAVAGLFCGLLVLQALAQAAGQDLDTGLVQGTAGGRDLLDDLAAASAGLDHADDAPDLALDAAQAGQDVGGGSLVELHNLTSRWRVVSYPPTVASAAGWAAGSASVTQTSGGVRMELWTVQWSTTASSARRRFSSRGWGR